MIITQGSRYSRAVVQGGGFFFRSHSNHYLGRLQEVEQIRIGHRRQMGAEGQKPLIRSTLNLLQVDAFPKLAGHRLVGKGHLLDIVVAEFLTKPAITEFGHRVGRLWLGQEKQIVEHHHDGQHGQGLPPKISIHAAIPSRAAPPSRGQGLTI